MAMAQRFSSIARRRIVTNSGNQIIGGVLLNQVNCVMPVCCLNEVPGLKLLVLEDIIALLFP